MQRRNIGDLTRSDHPHRRDHAGVARGAVLISSSPPVARDVGTIRARARTALERCTELTPETRDDALLVISELVTNAIVHARPPAVLRLSRHGLGRALRIAVTDGGPSPVRRDRSDGPPEEHGRGTGIVAALAAAHGVITRPEDVTRWADIPLPPRRPTTRHPGHDAPAAPQGRTSRRARLRSWLTGAIQARCLLVVVLV
jgi:anti-sigma regulatory factor (Ser/Thr protein kinase)